MTTAQTRVAAVIGHPVRHSLSPVLHNAAFRAAGLDWVYLAFEVEADGLESALGGVRALGIDGLSVTMPHKTATAGLVDRLSPVAEALQAVNTVVRRGGELVGENTDGDGFLAALRADEGFEPEGRRCLVVGAGGAARAVIRALAGAGAAEVVVVARRADAAAAAVTLAGPVGQVGGADQVADAELVVQATPVGMAGAGLGLGEALPIDPDRLAPGQLLVDLIYEPSTTPLVAAARDRGVAAVNGLGMLVHQAAIAFRLWTGAEAPLPVLSAAALGALAGPRKW